MTTEKTKTAAKVLPAASVVETAKEQFAKATETHFKAADEAAALGKSNVEAVMQAGSIFFHGFEELTGLDAVVITHQHSDHVDVERLPVLLEANDGAQLLVEPETCADLRAAGIDATAFHPGNEVTAAGVPLRAIGGQHAVIHPDIPRVGNVGVLVGTAISGSLQPSNTQIEVSGVYLQACSRYYKPASSRNSLASDHLLIENARSMCGEVFFFVLFSAL